MNREDWLPQTRANIHWLDRNYTTAQDHLNPSGGIKSEVHTKPGSRPPLNVAALSLTQRGGLAGQLTPWVELIVEERQVNPPAHRLADEPYFHATTKIILAHIEWCDEQEWFGDMRQEVWQLRRTVEIICGLVNESPIPGDRKRCALDRVLDDGTVIPCNGRLFQDHDRDVIYCRTCKTEWDKTQWLHLGRLLREMPA